jgi:hypothetical protein
MGAETHSKYLSLHEEEMVIIINQSPFHYPRQSVPVIV